MCRTTALFPVTGLANKPNKTLANMLCQANYTCRECCVFFTTHIRHTSFSYAVTISFSFWKPENVFGINKCSCDKWLGIIEWLKIIPSSLCGLGATSGCAFIFNNSAAQSQLFISGCFSKYILRQFLAMDFGSLSHGCAADDMLKFLIKKHPRWLIWPGN